MSTFLSSYLDDLDDLHREIISIIEQLPKDALDWSPCNNANSICVLVVHIAGAERYWIGDVIASDPSGRIRESEFRVSGLSAEELKKRLTDASSYCRGVITDLTNYDFRKGANFATRWSFGHSRVEFTSYRRTHCDASWTHSNHKPTLGERENRLRFTLADRITYSAHT